MTRSKSLQTLVLAGLAALVSAMPAPASGQDLTSGTVPTSGPVLARIPNIPPMNDFPNPYTSEDNWVKLPDGRTWGSTAGVDIDPDGIHLWAIDRCGANTCAGSDLDPILKIDPQGNVVESFGGGMILFPHGLHVDRQGNVWVTDGQGPNANNPATAGKGHVVLKFSPTGQLLLTLGEMGVAGNGTDGRLNTPNDVVTDAAGNAYVGDGHGGQSLTAAPDAVARVAVYDRNGRFLRTFGRLGSGPGEFRTPHGIDIDPMGRLVVADRGNNRIQFLELDGTYIGEMRQFGRPSGLYITDDNTLYVADSESEFDPSQNPGWITGIRVGSILDGIVDYRITGTVEAYPDGSSPEGVAVNAAGNVYGAVVEGGGAMIRSRPR